MDEYDFFSKMRPRMQTELINVIFKSFLASFEHFFSSLDQGFINELVVNLYAKTFQPGEDIISPG